MTTRLPNILLIVADCGRGDRWTDAAHAPLTPVLSRLRREATTFTQAIVEKACTTPSFSSLLTGRFSPRHGVHNVWGDRLPASVPMLTESLAAAGYTCYAEVTGPLLPEMGLARGFAEYDYRVPGEYLHTSWGERLAARLRGGLTAPWFLMLHLWELHHPRQTAHAPAALRERGDLDAYDLAVASLDAQLARVFEAAGDAVVIFTGDHGEKLRSETYRPGTAVAYARELLQIDSASGLLPGEMAGWAGPGVLQQFYGTAAPMLRDVRLHDLAARVKTSAWQRWVDRLRLTALTPWLSLRDLLALRDAEQTTAMVERRGLLGGDAAREKVQRLAQRLGRDRLMDMHLRMWLNSYKHNLDEGHMLHVYDFLVRVPLVIRWPGAEWPERCERLVRQVDILPTVLERLGVPLPDGIDGVSAAGRLGSDEEGPPAFVSVSGLPRDLELRGVRTERWKFSYGPHNAELPAELYDLHADPGETHNLAPANLERCREMQALSDAMAEHGAVTAERVAVSADERARVEAQLRDLGYID